MLIFEETTSALYYSNDARLHLSWEIVDGGEKTFMVMDSEGVVFATRDRVKADAYIAGYDLATS